MKKFAAFDIDGTLIRWQLYHAVVDRLAKKQVLGPDAKEQLHDARMKWKRREGSESFKEYEKKLIGIYEAALATLTTDVFDDTAQEIVQEYKEQVYVYTRNLVNTLQEQGYTLLAISGSHHELVAHIARLYGFDDWIGTQYERKNNRFTGQKFIGSQDKKTILEKLIDKHNLSLQGSYAIGDSASDAPMLAMVQQPIAFNPDLALTALARKNNWKIVVERKNVVYELKNVDNENPTINILP